MYYIDFIDEILSKEEKN